MVRLRKRIRSWGEVFAAGTLLHVLYVEAHRPHLLFTVDARGRILRVRRRSTYAARRLPSRAKLEAGGASPLFLGGLP